MNDGGPAFPNPMFADPHLPQSKYVEPNDKGMTLRDYFAAKAMQAIIAHSELCDDEGNFTAEPGKGFPAINVFASFAYTAADAMLAARKEAADGKRD